MRHQVRRRPSTLTAAEVDAILRASSRAERDLRDHTILHVALGLGLRVSEIAALNVGDVKSSRGAKGVWELRPEATKGCKGGTVALSDRLRRRVASFLSWKKRRGQSLEATSPLFCSRGGPGNGAGSRLSARSIQSTFHAWQRRAGFDRRLPFHSLRHTFCDRLWRTSGDLRVTQQAARHSSVQTTEIYTHPTLDDLLTAAENLPW